MRRIDRSQWPARYSAYRAHRAGTRARTWTTTALSTPVDLLIVVDSLLDPHC